MERIVNNSILNYLLDSSLITKHQHGFIRKRSTCTNLLESPHDWTLNPQNKKKTDVIYFDFKKAFDTVSHPKLLTKRKAYGLTGSLHFWVSEVLRERTQIVKINNNYSQSLSVISGVPQDSVLGPTLFLLYINDVCDLFADLSVSLKLYADDIKPYSHCDVSSSSDLDSAIGQLYNWSNTWQLQIAVDKCFCVISLLRSVLHIRIIVLIMYHFPRLIRSVILVLLSTHH